MRYVVITILAFLALSPAAWAQACDSGVWTQTNQQPTSCKPYALNGVFARELPNAGNGGPIDFRIHNSAFIVHRVLSDQDRVNQSAWGRTTIATPGLSEWGDVPVYYGRATDPIYVITAASCDNGGRCGTPGVATDARNTYWHIPNQAKYSGLGPTYGIGDQFMVVWDQTNNNVLYLYNGNLTTTTGTLPYCTATTQATACPIPRLGSAQKTNYTSSKDFQIENSGSSLSSAGLAMLVRHKEWMADDIRHALYLTTPCEADGMVFPGLDGNPALTCSSSGIDPIPAARPKHGALFFLDYTDAQISAMNLPAWQRPFIRALAHYGGYQGDTIGSTVTSMQISRIEGGLGYQVAGTPSPLYSWLESQGIGCYSSGPSESPCRYNLDILANIPAMTGPACPTVACGVDKHMHIANECVVKGLLGLNGHCGLPINAPNNLRTTSP